MVSGWGGGENGRCNDKGSMRSLVASALCLDGDGVAGIHWEWNSQDWTHTSYPCQLPGFETIQCGMKGFIRYSLGGK